MAKCVGAIQDRRRLLGALDFVAVVGTFLKSPIGPTCLVLAAVSQIVAYGLFHRAFMTKPEQLKTLRGMVVFHVVVLIALGLSFFLAVSSAGPDLSGQK